jgi:hypothetical protein
MALLYVSEATSGERTEIFIIAIGILLIVDPGRV